MEIKLRSGMKNIIRVEKIKMKYMMINFQRIGHFMQEKAYKKFLSKRTKV